MQLIMSKPFNARLAKEMLQQENKFISEIFSKMPLTMSELVDQEEQLTEERRVASKKVKVFKLPGGKQKRARTFEELHAKLEELKNKRLAYEERNVRKSLKNKLTKLSKREERSLRKKAVRTEENATGGSKAKKEEPETPKVPRAKPVFNSEGKMVFSKFDFSEIGTKKKPPKSEKDPKKILGRLKERKEKLRELEESGEKEKLEVLKEKEAWKSVLAKSGGAKIKDDPELLKKTIKRQEGKKKRSAKKWDARNETVRKGLRERQEKRQENIAKRKKEKKVHKLKKAAKKGRVIPGY